jgi:GT2 family glycosyltransferase
VVVVSWNTRALLRRCLNSVGRFLSHLRHEVLVVDNASRDGSADMVAEEFPQVRLFRNSENLGFGRANNQAMAGAKGEFFLLLNSDAELLDDGMGRLLERVRARPEVGVAGLRILYPDGRVQASARRFPTLRRICVAGFWMNRVLPRTVTENLLLGHYWDHCAEREADWVIGACMLVRREVFHDTGGFDPSIFLYGEEVEWCHRIRERGWKVLFSPLGSILHLDHQSTNQLLGDDGRRERCLIAEDALIARWQGPLAGALVPPARIGAALLRIGVFGLRGWFGLNDTYGRDVRSEARGVLRHYGRRWLGGMSHETRPTGV